MPFLVVWPLVVMLARRSVAETTASMTAMATTSLAPSATSSALPRLLPTAATAPDLFDGGIYGKYLLTSLCALIVCLALYRSLMAGMQYVRTLACLTNEKQVYFKYQNPTYAMFKEHLFYAPLFGKRHREEVQLFRGWTMGGLATRSQSLFIALLIAGNIWAGASGIPWSDLSSADRAAMTAAAIHLRSRSGVLAVINLVPMILLAGRNNPLLPLLNMPSDTFIRLHRWFGRIIAAGALVHMAAWLVSKVRNDGWHTVLEGVQETSVMLSGTVAMLATLLIILQSMGVLRRLWYEFFLHLHITLAIAVMVGLWHHLAGLDELVYLKVALAIWAIERSVRLARLIYRSAGRGGSRAIVEALPGDAVRVTLKLARPWTFAPGQHMYLTVPSIGLWTSHPFSVAWSDTEDRLDDEKGLATSNRDVLRTHATTLSAVVRRRDGFTDALFRRADASPDGRVVLHALAEGPYGAQRPLHSYGTVLLFAGGVGITHQLPYVRDLVAGRAAGRVAVRRICLVWVIRAPEHLEWVRPWMTSILALDGRRDVLRIRLFVTRPRNTREIHSPSETVLMFPGRPNVDTIVGLEVEDMVGAMAVSVCGTGGLADGVREAVRRRQDRNVDFVEECFSW